MKEPIEGSNWFFVDESGDPTFYDRNGNLIIGQPGCSPILILGFAETTEPAPMRRALAELHREIAADEYLKGVPSVSKTNIAFHAKDDAPEVREKAFKLIRTLDFKTQFVVARKIERVFQNTFHGKESRFYEHLVSLLFSNAVHRHTENHIYFAKRGSTTRQAPLASAIQIGIKQFEEKYRTTVNTKWRVSAQVPDGEPCLQIIDYMNWAVYRAFVKREMRYYRFVEDKISLLVDLYDTENYPKNWYNRHNPFDIEKASPL